MALNIFFIFENKISLLIRGIFFIVVKVSIA